MKGLSSSSPRLPANKRHEDKVHVLYTRLTGTG